MPSTDWERDNVHFELTEESGAVEVVLPGFGWVHGTRRYSLTATEMHGPCDSRTWVVISRDDDTDEKGADGVVIESIGSTEPFGPFYSRYVDVRVWRVPTQVVGFPTQLLGSDTAGIETWLLRSVAVPLTDFRIEQGALSTIPEVEVDAIEPQIRDLLRITAEKVGESGQLELDLAPVKAAREYIEDEPGTNLNQTVCCRWRWRLTYRVQRNSTSGFLTVEVSGFGLDAHDRDGADHVNESTVAVWLALPGNKQCLGAVAPGTLISPPVYSR